MTEPSHPNQFDHDEEDPAIDQDRILIRAEESFRRQILSKGIEVELVEIVVAAWRQSPEDVLITVHALETYDEIVATHPDLAETLPDWYVPR